MTITDNIGIIVASLFRARSTLTTTTPATLRDINGVLFAVRTYGGNSSANFNVSGVIHTAQVGKGLSPPTRQDFNIENPFTNGGVEDTKVNSLNAVYNVAQARVEMGTAIGATIGSGTITEVCKFVTVNQDTGTDRIILVSRDLLVIPVSFIPTNTINIDHRVEI